MILRGKALIKFYNHPKEVQDRAHAASPDCDNFDVKNTLKDNTLKACLKAIARDVFPKKETPEQQIYMYHFIRRQLSMKTNDFFNRLT